MHLNARDHIWAVGLCLLLCSIVCAFPNGRQATDEARRLFWLAKAQASEEARLKLFEQGASVGHAVLEKEPENPAAILWWVANEGAIGEMKRDLASLGTLRRVERALLHLRALDPGYGYAAADRALGKIYWKAPRFISIGSSGKAEESLRNACRLAPGYPGNQLALADFLLDEGKEREARQIALDVLRGPAYQGKDFGEFSPERKEWQATLSTLLARTGGKLP